MKIRYIFLIYLALAVGIWILSLFYLSRDQPIKKNERYYQKIWCDLEGGKMEVVMPDKTRCDCLTATHAVEFDFAKKWAEAIGQSLNYARLTDKIPGVVLICNKKSDRKKVDLIRKNSDFYGLKIEIFTINCGGK